MKTWSLIFMGIIVSLSSVVKAQDIDNTTYPYDPAIQKNPAVPSGEILEREFTSPSIYPGTTRKYWIYVPEAYRPEKPACLYVNMDGIGYNAPIVFDNLIASGEMPIAIGVFIGPGTIYDAQRNVLRYNRSNEFDRIDNTFARFIEEELLPEVEKQKTSDGREIKLSKDPNDRAIAGGSSGAICAFTVAWQRPDLFRRVFSSIGTYVAMRGGNDYPALIRKTEPKPLRIFLEDGVYDAWNPLFGNWFEANQLMESALNFAGYEVKHDWGRGAHGGVHAAHIFPDAMRWLWKGYPSKVQKGESLNNMLTSILLKNEEWKEIKIGVIPQNRLFTDEGGNIIFADTKRNVYRLDSIHPIQFIFTLPTNGKLLGTNGNSVYYTDSHGKIFSHSNGKKTIVTADIPNASSMVALFDKSLYIAQENKTSTELWLIHPNGEKGKIEGESQGGTELAIYPNQKMLIQSERNSHWLYSYIREEDGTLKFGQRFYWLHNVDNSDFMNEGNMVFDIEGNLYVATSDGVQVCDQNGRVRAILTLPSGRIFSVTFGGSNHDILYVLSNGKVFCRKMKIKGAEPWITPFNPKSQGAG